MLNRASHVSASLAHGPARGSLAPRPSRRHARVLATALALTGLLSCSYVAPAGADSVPTTCDKVASQQGSDAGNGSPSAPFRTVGALAASLSPGQVGCVHAGTYAGGLRIGHGGAPGAPIVLRSYPGEQALITGRVYVPQGSDYVTIGDISLDGNFQGSGRLPSPTINANHVTFESDDVTNDHTEICFDVGSSTWGMADSTVIAHNRIHDCGVIPATNHQHGIYVQDATNTQIVGNTIVNNADRGVQLYPNSTGAVISENVIAGNGEGVIFSGEGGVTSNGNLVEHNLIVNSQIRRDIESWYPSGTPLGVGNLAQGNCVSARGIDTSSGGFTAQGNVTASPAELIATGAGAYAAAPGSACAAVLAATVGGGGPAPSGGAPPPAEKEAGTPAKPAHKAGPAASSPSGPTSQAASSGPAVASDPVNTATRPPVRAAHPTSAHRHHRHHAKRRRTHGPQAHRRSPHRHAR
jgi:parallel beta-helix repeat protein